MAGVDYSDVRNYHHCKMKSHNMWMCKPPAGTIIIDKLRYPEAVKAVGGRTYFTVADVAWLSARNPQMHAILQQFVILSQASSVGQNDAVICGTRGQLMLVNLEQAKRQYCIRYRGRWSDAWAVATLSKSVDYGSEQCFEWVKIHSYGSIDLCACFVPVTQIEQVVTYRGTEIINVPGVDHGLGDFIICPYDYDNIGRPHINSKQIVNGLVFGDTFDNRTWERQLKRVGENQDLFEPQSLFPKM